MSVDNIDPKPSQKVSDLGSSPLFSEGAYQRSSTIHNWRECFPEIVGRSKALSMVLETVSRIATSDSAVLIYGASGTGKELIAAALHRLSSRANKRFVPLNCSAIPESLLESELFGHERGAFTGATNRRPGHFEVANGGTLFLDEIGDMPLRLQAKLLRVLQEKQFTSVGGHLIKSSDVRIIAATNVDLGEAIREGRFRMDLFYRLNVLPVVMPTLSERREDIPALLANFLDIANRMNPHKDSCFLTDEVVDVLCHYEWPGNIRELQNLVERLVVTSHGGEITTDDLPAEYRALAPLAVGPKAQRSSVSLPVAIGPSKAGPSIPASFGELPVQGIDLSNYIATIENNLINQALARTSNNKNQAAKLLGLNRTTLVERLKKRKIAGESPDDSDNKDA